MFRFRNLLLLAFVLTYASVTCAQVEFRRNGRKCVGRTETEKKLLNAVSRRNESAVRQLLQKGGDAMTDDCGNSILMYATTASHPGILQLLIGAGADVNAADGSIYKVPLARAVCTIDPDDRYAVVKLLVESGANVNGGNGRTPLLEAVAREDIRLVELLIAWGADVNLQDHDESAYSLAAERGNKKLRNILLAAGADPTAGAAIYRNIYGPHAFFQAAADGRVDVIEAMVSSGTATANMTNASKVTALMRAENEFVVEALVNAGADVNLQDDRGFTALMWAAEIRRIGVVKKLIAVGANVNLRRNDGKALIDLVEADGEIEKLLIAAGAKRR